MSIHQVELPDQASKHLKLFYYPTVHSTTEGHRTKLRQLLMEVLEKFDPKFPHSSELLELDKLPTAPGKGISISHSPRGSAILLNMMPGKVGVDVELTSRISEKILARISTINEIDSTPSQADLFTAKEAAWKALNSKLKVPTVSHIETTHWSSLSPPWHQYYVMVDGDKAPGVGYSGQFGEIYLSFFSTPSTFS